MTREPTTEGRALPLAMARRVGLTVVAGALVAVAAHAWAQTPRPAAAASPAVVREEGVRWQALTPVQREALAPLERDWPGIDAPRKQKWIALAARFKALPPEERARIHERMVEWAKLTPAERGQARLRFEEARQLPVPDRGERWRAYQALPPEQREQLAARAATAASAPRDGASRPQVRSGRDAKEAKFNVVPNPALAQPPRPVAPTLVQAAPGATTTVITRRPAPPPHQQSGMPKIATTPEFVNRSTLLPKRGPQAAAIASAPLAPMPAVRLSPSPAAAHSAMPSPVPSPAPAPSPAALAATPASAPTR